MRGSVLRSSSVQLTAASVRPAASSMTCAKTPRLERNTEIRGRSAVPVTFARTRRRRLRRLAGRVATVMRVCSAWWSAPRRRGRAGCGSCAFAPRGGLRPGGAVEPVGGSCALSYLPRDVLALVADPLALVGLGRPLLADHRGDLADLLLGVALDDHAGRLRDLELDALRRLDRHGVRVAQRELEVGALELGAVADALDLQRLREAVGDPGDHVGDEGAGEPVQRAMLRAIGRAGDDQLLALLPDLDRAVLALLEVAAGAGHAHDLGLDRDGDAGGDGDGPLTDSLHRDRPDLRADLAADALPAGVVAGHHATRGRDDRGAHAAEHLGDGAGVHVGPLAGTRDALQARDHRLA